MTSFFLKYNRLNILIMTFNIVLFSILFLPPFFMRIDNFWQDNLFLTITSSILGFIFYFSLFFYLYINIVLYIPNIRKLNHLKLLQVILLLFLVDMIQSGENAYVSLNFYIISSLLILFIILISHLYIHFLIQSDQLFHTNTLLNMIKKDSDNIAPSIKSSKLPYYLVFFIGATLYVSSWNYYLYGLILFLLYLYATNYFKCHVTPKKRRIKKIVQSLFIYVLILSILIIFNNFLSQHIVIHNLLLICPFISISPNILNELYYAKLYELELQFLKMNA